MSQITRDEKEPPSPLSPHPSSLLEVASAAAATLQPLSDTMAIICDGGREMDEPTLFNGGKWRRRTFSSYFFATSVGSGRASFSLGGRQSPFLGLRRSSRTPLISDEARQGPTQVEGGRGKVKGKRGKEEERERAGNEVTTKKVPKVNGGQEGGFAKLEALSP